MYVLTNTQTGVSMSYFRHVHINLRPQEAEALDYLIKNKPELSGQTEILRLLILKEAAKLKLKKEKGNDDE